MQNNYIKSILIKLIDKQDKRTITYENNEINRRIAISPKEIYRTYFENNADFTIKDKINEAIIFLENKAFITSEKVKFSSDYQKIYLNKEKIKEIKEYIKNEYGIFSRDDVEESLKALAAKYLGALSEFYSKILLGDFKSGKKDMDLKNIEDIYDMLYFLDNNTKKLYIREASMLVYGTSKYFEMNTLKSVCDIIQKFQNCDNELNLEDSENLLEQYNIIKTNGEIFLKGDIKIFISNSVINLKELKNGFAISSADIASIKKIEIGEEKFLTIENKTSFYRINDSKYSTMFLSGYATYGQIELIKKIQLDNPNLKFCHFGDIFFT